ncbi:diguanylate cyclase [Marinomonas sp. THO17]|uniref:diguanylate cyclase n=1 Tax=Marinomonas sp. THO17 TaxID=3149048 RepID=UPI00336C2ECA
MTVVNRQKVLVIDDERINLKIISDILREDADVVLAISGEQGIRKAIEYKPDLILLDVLMPGLDGYETMNRLRHDVRTSTIPVIFITALDDASHEEKALLMGACDYIQKPLNHNIVQARVRLHLQLTKQRKLLEQLANIDPLTALANRRRYEEFIVREWQTAIQHNECLSLLVLDIDNFKQYNDCYGHATGDKVLKRVATVLAGQIKPGEGLVARYGGEEFVVVLPRFSQQEAERIAKKCMLDIEELNLSYSHQGQTGQVTVSVGGVCVSPLVGDLVEDFFDKADSKLVEAKNSGKNKILWFHSHELDISVK